MKNRTSVPPRYFCASCGCEVAPGTKRCPRCLKEFTAVRCPRCGFEGREQDFAGGCPACGHLQPTFADPASSRSRRPARGRGSPAEAPAPKARGSSTLLPRRFYAWAGACLTVAAVILLVLLLVLPWARR